MNKTLFGLLISTIFLLSSATAEASTVTCQPIYGGGQSCTQSGNVSINKRVFAPNGGLVDNLGINDTKFGPESLVNFQIAITNTGNSQIATVQVKDIFPQYIDFSSGAGNYDSSSKTLSFDVSGLNPSETRTFTVVGKVVKAESLPVDKGIVCVVNQATAKDASSSQVSQDNTQVCIQKSLETTVTQTGTTVVATETKGGLKVFPPQKVLTSPATGPEMIPLMALLPTGILGAFLRKKAVK